MAKLQEFVQSDASGKVDREAGVIRGVKLLGFHSRNGRRYAESAIRSAASKYEGARVHVDHGKPGDNRSIMTRGGTIRGVKVLEGKGLYGDLHYLKDDPAGEKIATLAEQCPDTFGMSHDADGRIERRDGETVVEEIHAVNSVDAVDRPATTDSLHEHVDPNHSTGPAMKKTTLRKLIEATGYKHTAKLLEMLPEVAPEEEVAVVEPEGDAPDPVDAVADALAQKVGDAIKDPAVSDAEAGQMAKAASKTVATVRSDMEPKAEAPAEEEPTEEGPDDDAEKVPESVAKTIRGLTESVARLTKQQDARSVLEAKGAAVTPQLLEELSACNDRAAMESLVEGWAPAKLGRERPRVGALRESHAKDLQIDSADDYLGSLKARGLRR